MSERIQSRWRQGTKTYVRNLFVGPHAILQHRLRRRRRRTIHPSNVGLSVLSIISAVRQRWGRSTSHHRAQLERTEQVNRILESSLDPHVLDSTRTVDGKLSDFVEDSTRIGPPTSGAGAPTSEDTRYRNSG